MTQMYENYQPTQTSVTDMYGARWRAQTFTTTNEPHTITSIKIKLAKTGASSVGPVYVSIRTTDENSEPTGDDLTVGQIAAADIPNTTPALREISVTQYTPDVNKKYAIVVRAPNASIFYGFTLGGINTSGIYDGGEFETSFDSGATWSISAAWDTYFEIWGSPITVYAKTHDIDAALRKLGIIKTLDGDAALRRSAISEPLTVDAVLKDIDIFRVFGMRCWIHDRSIIARKYLSDALLKKLDIEEAVKFAAALEASDFLESYGIDAFLVFGIERKHLIDVALKKYDLETQQRIATAISVLDSLREYEISALLVHRYLSPYFADVLIKKIGTEGFGAGAYLVSPQKFELSLSFQQFEVDTSFEQFEVEPSFEQFQVTPYFQEV